MHKGFFKNIIRNFSLKLKTQLIASFIIMSFFIFLIGFILSYTNMVNILQKQSYQNNLNQFKQFDYNIESFKKDVDKISRLIAISKDLQDYLNYPHKEGTSDIDLKNAVFKMLSQVIGNYEYIESIYCYGENGLIIGVTPTRNVSRIDTSKMNDFYCSPIHNSTKANIMSIQYFGGYSSKDFDFNFGDYANSIQEIKYITAARSVNIQGIQKATLVININESYFTSIYNNNTAEKNIAMFIMDEKGIIVSHTDNTKINSRSDIIDLINPNKQYGNHIINDGSNSAQVIYYRFNTGWVLVKEIPLNIVLGDIIQLRRIFIMLFAGSLAIAFCISIYWIYKITKPLNELTAAMHEMEKGNLGLMLVGNCKNELGVLGMQFNKMSASILNSIEQIKIMENEKRELEIKSLQAQINPHFLYNTLNIIKYMALIIKANNIVDCITALGNILTPLYRDLSISCSLNEEMKYVENYIKIMNFRFGERIKVVLNIPNELQKCEILRFILQPLIENTLSHGMGSSIQKIDIDITADETNGVIQLNITDNGIGMDQWKLAEVRESLLNASKQESNRENRIGLNNVQRRIKLHYGEAYGLFISSEIGGGTTVMLNFPKMQDLSH
jgi:two-component system, sensor histidine kinase YesM